MTHEQRLRKAISLMEIVKSDCDLALTDQWDRSDAGFTAIKDVLDDAITLINPDADAYENERRDVSC